MLETSTLERTVGLIRAALPAVEAVYLFGSFASGDETPESDVDIALLLTIAESKALGNLYGSDLHRALEGQFMRDIDLVNLRQVSTVLQMQVISKGQLIFEGDLYTRQTFEMYTLSFYQKLNEERAEILESLYETGRAYAV